MAEKQVPNLAAVLETPKARVTIVERPIPAPGPKELVVRNHAVAANPVDWKIQEISFFVDEDKYPVVLGSDVSGVVTAVGSSVSKFKVGDKVAGFAGVIFNSKIDHGAFQTYTVLQEPSATKIPATMSFEEGALIPMGAATAAAGLFLGLGTPLPSTTDVNNDKKQGLLVWGAASAVGTWAIQIGKALGFTIFATASPAHHSYLKSLGASEIFGYKDPDVSSKLVAAAEHTKKPITCAFDAIGGKPSVICANVVATSGKEGKVAHVAPWPENETIPKGVKSSMLLAFHLATERPDVGEWFFNDWLSDALEKKTVIPTPKIEIVDGGIRSTQKVWDMLKAGVSGKKLVIQVE